MDSRTCSHGVWHDSVVNTVHLPGIEQLPVWLQNQLISAGLESVPAILKNQVTQRIAYNFPRIVNKNYKINTSFVRPGLRPL